MAPVDDGTWEDEVLEPVAGGWPSAHDGQPDWDDDAMVSAWSAPPVEGGRTPVDLDLTVLEAIDGLGDQLGGGLEILEAISKAIDVQATAFPVQTRLTMVELLAEQLDALDHRQAVIEDGLRAIWERLDALDGGADQPQPSGGRHFRGGDPA